VHEASGPLQGKITKIIKELRDKGVPLASPAEEEVPLTEKTACQKRGIEGNMLERSKAHMLRRAEIAE